MSWGERSCFYLYIEEKPCTPMIETCNTNCPYYKHDGKSEPDSPMPVAPKEIRKAIFILKEVTAEELQLGEVFLQPNNLGIAGVSRFLLKKDDHFYRKHLIGLPGQPTEEDWIKELIKICGWIVIGRTYRGNVPSIKCQKIIKKAKGLKFKNILLGHIKVITTSKIVEYKDEPAGNSADIKL